MFRMTKSKDPDGISQPRRWFFKGVATAGVALASVGGLVTAFRGDKQKMDYQAAYDQDVLPGDKIMQNNGFEEISQAEKEEMAQLFTSDYEHSNKV